MNLYYLHCLIFSNSKLQAFAFATDFEVVIQQDLAITDLRADERIGGLETHRINHIGILRRCG